MNRIILIGRLTKDPELRYTQNSIAVCNFTLAVDRRISEEKQTDFIDIVAWRGLAENCAKYLAKGKLAAVDGKLQPRFYEKDGVRRTIVEVLADEVQFLSPATAAAKQEETPAAPPALSDDEVPF